MVKIFILVVFLFVCSVTPVLAIALHEQVLIEAADGVDYDMEQNITTATKHVELTRGELKVYADRVVYYGNTGLVEAFGNVRLTNPQGEYRTDHLTYNVFTSSGKLDSFTANLAGTPKDFHFKGKGLELTPQKSEVASVEVTRCPQKNPDYVLKASQIRITGNKVQLKHVIVKIKGIPLFYLPVLGFYTNLPLPDVEVGYSGSDGLKAKFDFSLWMSASSELTLKGDLATKGDDSVLGLEYATTFQESSKNEIALLYNTDGWWKIADTYTYETDLLKVVVDGFKNFSDSEENQLGFNLTRKYWTTGIGDWQVSLLARRVKALDDQEEEYGGTYSGVQVDYRINPNLKVSYLGIRSQSGDDYRDLLEDFGVGDNGLYEINLPLREDLKLQFSGTYNFDESKWYHQVYSMTKVDCCFSPTVSYDRADHSWEFKVGFKF